MRAVGIWVACALLLVGCAQPETGQDAVVETDDCSAPDMPQLQGGNHLIGDQQPPVPYTSVPPTSGWHSSGSLEVTVQPAGDPLNEAEQVSALEAGAVVVSHNGLGEEAVASIREFVTGKYPGRVAVTEYSKLDPGSVAFTAWGVRQVCDAVDLAALDAFVQTYADEAPAQPGDQ